MTVFKIYKESEKFVWTRKRILFGFFLISYAFIAIKVYLIKDSKYIDENSAQIFGYICVDTIFLGIINSFFSAQLKGKLDGELILDYSKIIIRDKKYNLTDIKSIKIAIGPFKGQIFPSGYAIFSDIISNGINNELIIILNSNEIVKCNFQIDSERKILQATEDLKNYLNEGKLSYENYQKINE